MADYIKREQIEEMLDNSYVFSSPDGEYSGYCTADICLESIPSADVVKVVRCKDCEHCYYDQIYFRYWCERTAGIAQVKENDFCSYGKKKNKSGVLEGK